jgi:hypothetical protein
VGVAAALRARAVAVVTEIDVVLESLAPVLSVTVSIALKLPADE